MQSLKTTFRYLFESAYGSANHFIARWLFLRALGLVYFSAFFALLFQVRGLIGSQGILPAIEYLHAVQTLGLLRFWYTPTLLWLSSSDRLLMALCWIGLIASVVLVANVWPRVMLAVCFLCFLSFVSAAQDFSGYQSDGMLLEAGFLSLFLAPAGLYPGLGRKQAPVRAAMFLLLWEWFRIYFQSGMVKLESGDPTWRNLTAMYEYYQNGPLPTWIGWYLQHLPTWFHIASAAMTLVMELILVWMAFLPGRWKTACFFVVTVWQVFVIATANYAFLNYLVLVLAIFLLDDAFLLRFIPSRWRARMIEKALGAGVAKLGEPLALDLKANPLTGVTAVDSLTTIRSSLLAVALTWIFYATVVPFVQMFWREAPLPAKPVAWLEPFRIANQYGLFAVMTPHRYEIEFRGSNDGEHCVAYPLSLQTAGAKGTPRIYAPYQPRFDWNLWFASLGSWQTESHRSANRRVAHRKRSCRAGAPCWQSFPSAPPRVVRAVLWQYWFSSPEQKHTSGVWWSRQFLGNYAPTLTRLAGKQAFRGNFRGHSNPFQ
jgi:hypothetical protein